MATRNPIARALASATSRLWFPATLACVRRLPRASMHRGGRRVASIYYRLFPRYLGAARANLSIILGKPEEASEVREKAFAMVCSHFDAWVDFLHFATRPPEESRRLIESVEGYENIVEARRRGKGVLLLTAHLGNWEVGGLMLAEVKQPIHVVLVPDIFPGVERERRRLHERSGVKGDPGGPELRPDAGRSPRPRRQRRRRDAGRPGFRQHRHRIDLFREGGLLSARAPARGDGLGSRRPARLHRARAGREVSGDRRGPARDRNFRRPRRGPPDEPRAVRRDPRTLCRKVPGAVVLLLPVLGRPFAQVRTLGGALDAPTRAERRFRHLPTSVKMGPRSKDYRQPFATRTPAAESPGHDTRIHFSAAC